MLESLLMAVEGDRLQIAAPNKFSRDWLAEHYLPALAAAAQDCLGGSPQVSIVVDATPAPARSPGDDAALPAPTSTASGLNPRYTFETFVVGSSNQFAQAACQAVAELPSKAYNPLFIYGGGGRGRGNPPSPPRPPPHPPPPPSSRAGSAWGSPPASTPSAIRPPASSPASMCSTSPRSASPTTSSTPSATTAPPSSAPSTGPSTSS